MFRKTVIPISYLPTARQTLRWGAQLTCSFHSDLTILYVNHTRQSGPINLSVTHEKMTEWGVEPPSFKLLREAEALIRAAGVIQLDERGREVERHAFKGLSPELVEVHLKGVHDEHIRLRLREGPVVAQILKEVDDPSYDLIFIGTRGQRGLRRHLLGSIAHDVALQAPCSVLVAKHLDRARAVLLGASGRESAREAIRQGVELARALELPVRLISIYSRADDREQAQTNLDAALNQVRALDYEAESLLEQGEPAKTLIQVAGQDHVLALGRAPLSLVQRFFLGDISQRILDRGRCSVLIAVPPRAP